MRHLFTRLTSLLFTTATRPTTTRTLLPATTRPIQQIPIGYTILPAGFLSSFFSTSKPDMAPRAVQKSEQEWRAILSPEQFRVLREKGTERPGTSPFTRAKSDGIYTCAGCDTPLYKSSTKFDAHCGWPAFYEGLPGAIETHEDNSLGMSRIEIVCKNCGGHLGHVFKNEGYPNPTNERHCVNGVSLKFEPANES